MAGDAPERRELRDDLNHLLWQLDSKTRETERTDAIMVAMIVRLDRIIDTKMGEKAPKRQAGDLSAMKEPRQCLRMLLWKHGDPDYARPLNAKELMEHLKASLIKAKVIPGEGHE